MQQKNALTYSVLSDPGNQIAGRLGILTAPTEDARAAQAGLGLDISVSNADGTYNLPMPTVVILDKAGAIRWIDVHPNYTARSEPGQILDALDATLAGTTKRTVVGENEQDADHASAATGARV
jgi:peroxiredoxin